MKSRWRASAPSSPCRASTRRCSFFEVKHENDAPARAVAGPAAGRAAGPGGRAGAGDLDPPLRAPDPRVDVARVHAATLVAAADASRARQRAAAGLATLANGARAAPGRAA